MAGHACGEEEPDWLALAAVDTLIVLMGVARRAHIARQLIAAGRSAGEPVAFIENATLPSERVMITDLESVAAGQAEVASPAVMVAGEAARVRVALAGLAAPAAQAAGAFP